VASCIKCGANLVAQARFCAACGSPVGKASVHPAPIEAEKPSAPDPFAKTVLGDATSVPLPPPKPTPETKPQAVLSPLAASVMKDPSTPVPPPPRRPSDPVPQPAWSAQPQPVSPSQPRQPAMPAGMPGVQPAMPPQPYFVPGAMVLVYWADGNQYPGTVLQVSPYHVLVAFPNGAQQWVEMRYVTSGR
jgi:hypothetical protein